MTVTAMMPAPEINFFHQAGLDGIKVGADKKDDPAEVAQQGFEVLMAGEDSIIANSLKSKVEGTLGSILPDSASVELNRHLNKPGSGI